MFVVDDERLLTRALGRLLTTAGYDLAGTAGEADDAIHQIVELQPDLVVLDIHLGRGESGIDVALRLAGRYDGPIVFVSAELNPDFDRLVGRDAVFAFVAKPIDQATLHASLRLALVQQRTRLHRRPRTVTPVHGVPVPVLGERSE